MKFIIAAALLLLPMAVPAIGRSGNGSVDGTEDGFSTVTPDQFPEVTSGRDGSIALLNPMAMTGLPEPLVIYAHRLAIFYPDRSRMDRDTLKAEFTVHGFAPGSLKQDGCVDLYYSQRGSAQVVVAAWGIGKGVVFVGTRNGFVSHGIEQMVDNLQLQPGACAWK